MATEYAKTRIAFGRPIGANQGVLFQISDLAVMAESARVLDLQGRLAQGRAHPWPALLEEVKRAASIASLYSTEAAVAATRITAPQIGRWKRFHGRVPGRSLLSRRQDPRVGEGTAGQR